MNINKIGACRVLAKLQYKKNTLGRLSRNTNTNQFSVRNLVGLKIGDLDLDYGPIVNKEYFKDKDIEKAGFEQVKKSPAKIDVDVAQDDSSTSLSITLTNIRSVNISCTLDDISSEEN